MAFDAKLSLGSGTSTATITGTGVDLVTGTNKDGLCARVIVTTVAGTSPTFDPKIQHSDDNTTFTDLATGNPSRLTAAGVAEIRFSSPKRYFRFFGTIGGTAPSFVWSAEISNATEFSE